MIPDIKELNFPQYATLSQATVNIADMAEKTITSQIKIDGEITPDFSTDWEVEFQGDKYIMPLRQPQGAKENTSLNSTINLTFQHWAIYQLKRWMFFTVQPVETGTAVADKYIADVQLNLGDFCDLFGQVLYHYFGDTITIDLNPDWEYKTEQTYISINHSYIWDVLIKLYELFAVRWQIEPNSTNNNGVKGGERYIIKVGYPTTDVGHIFEYGFEGGLLKVERQVQNEDIRNMILGCGGEKNLPLRYFKDVDSDNPDFRGDPDWVEELANIYFTNLHGATFRSYVQGWKAAHINQTNAEGKKIYAGYKPVGESNAYAPWAYHKGYTDAKFDPVEYVADEIIVNAEAGDRHVTISPTYAPPVKEGSSIDKYGPLLGGLDNNEDIYPTIQGVIVSPYGRIDEAVDIEQVTTDKYVEDPESPDATIKTLGGSTTRVDKIGINERLSVSIKGNEFTVPSGKFADLYVYPKVYLPSSGIAIESYQTFVHDKNTGETRSASGIPEGDYYFTIKAEIHNETKTNIHTIDVGIESAKLQDATISSVPGGTFSVWVKNIWNTKKGQTETDAQYAERIWAPILGDRDKNKAKVVFSTGMLSASQDYEFTIPNGFWPRYDTSKTLIDGNGNTYLSHWRIILAKSDADLESTGIYVPSTKRQGKPGDHFFFIGTEMTHDYTLWAEQQLDDYKKDSLREVKDIRPTWVVSLDKIRIGNKQEGESQAIISKLNIGSGITVSDKRFIGGSQQENLYIQSITYTYGGDSESSSGLLPNVEIVLSDNYEIAANPIASLQGEITAIQKQIASVSNIEQIVRTVGDKKYLRKDTSDKSPYSLDLGGSLGITEKTTAKSGVQFGPDFVPGMTGLGGLIDGHGNGELESLTLRRSLTVPELNYNRVEISVGDDWSAPGGGVIETLDGAGQLATLHLEEGEIGTLRVGDICMGIFHSATAADNATADSDDGRGNRTFAGFATCYFRVTEVLGDRYDRFRYEVRPASGRYPRPVAPMEMMSVVAYGSFTNPARRTSRYSTRTYQRYLRGVSDWEFTRENIAAQFGDLTNLSVFGMQMTGYSAYLDNIYMQGVLRSLDNTFVIDTKTRTLLIASPSTGFGLAYNPEQGLTIGSVYDPATGRFTKEYDLGLIEQTADSAQQAADDAAQVAADAQAAADEAARKAQQAQDYIDTTLPAEIARINARLDGVVENWFLPYSPTMANEPTATWIKDGEEAIHVGDTFTNTQEYVDDKTTPDAGKSWRWVEEGSGYKWTPIADSDAVKALLAASKAQATADGKSRNFVVTPTPPYSVGDWWSQGEAGQIMRCVKARATGSFVAADWAPAGDYYKYTDTKLDNLQVGSVNLLDGSREVTITAPAGDNYKWLSFALPLAAEVGDRFSFNADAIETLAGDATVYSVGLYDRTLNTALSPRHEITSASRSHTFVVTRAEATPRLLIYAGERGHTSGNTVRYTRFSLVRGDKPLLTWAPSVSDQQAAIDAAQAASDAAQETLAAMNDDGVLDIAEKQALRTQWELISGHSQTDTPMDGLATSNGSYYKTRDAATVAGVSIASLQQAVGALRSKLNGYGLYTDLNTPKFDRAGLAALFTAYYAAEIDTTKRTADAVAQGKVDNIQVGGVNLLLGTRDEYRFLDSAREGVTVTSAIAGGFRETTVKPSGIADVDLAYGSSWAKLSSFPVAGRTYTFSLEYRTNAPAASFRLSLRDPIMVVDRPLPDTGGEWRRIWWREAWNVTTQTKILLVLDVNSIDTSRYVAVRRMKLEEGDVATAWTAAPEETTAVYAENLALKSNLRIETANYAIGNYYLAEDLANNTDYTVTVWGELGAGKSAFGVYTGGGYQPGVDLKKIGEGVYSGILSIGTTIGGDGRRDRIQLYARPNSVTGVVSTVERVKLERGVNLRPSWTPASSEMLGADAVTYEVEPSVLVVGLGEGGVLAPSLVTFRSWTRTGAEAKRTAYAGRMVIAESTDGNSYTTRYTSAADEASHTYAISGNTVRFVRCSLYAAGGVTSLLDQQTVTVVPEAGAVIDRLNDDAIFEVWEKRAMRAEWYTISGKRTASSPAGQGLYIDAMNKFGEEAVVKAVGSYYDWLDAYFVAFDLWTDTDTRVDAEGKAFSKEALQRMLDLFYRGLQQLTYTLTDSFGYLKDAFGDMTTQQTAGVVLTGFSGVKNTAGAVVAGMAGKNFLTGAEFAPDDESCPIFFAGAKSLLQANTAKTRIYPSGLLVTSEIKATGGEFGFLHIESGKLTSSHESESGVGHGIELTDGYMRSWNGPNNDLLFGAGGNTQISTIYSNTSRGIIISKVYDDGSMPETHVGVYVGMSKAKSPEFDNRLIAFYTDNGSIESVRGDIQSYYGDLVTVRGNIRGRHMPRVATASGANMVYIDSTYWYYEVIILSGLSSTVYLPNPNYGANLEAGEFYDLINVRDRDITIRMRSAATTPKIITPDGAATDTYTLAMNHRCRVIWDGNNWRVFE